MPENTLVVSNAAQAVF